LRGGPRGAELLENRKGAARVEEGSVAPVAVLRRSIGASLERVWENVLDWEHLPCLHDASFESVECLDEGEWGWRARARLPGPRVRTALYEVVIDRAAQRYVARTLEGSGQGTEIWTKLDPTAPHCTAIEVSFCVPDVAPEDRERIGSIYLALYERLWDEDEQMMIEREGRLASARRPTSAGSELALGVLEEVRAKAPYVVELDGHPYRIVDLDGELRVHSALCPHRLGPLVEECDGSPGQVRCPWHGYRFDIPTGRSCDGRSMRLARAAELSLGENDVLVLRT